MKVKIFPLGTKKAHILKNETKVQDHLEKCAALRLGDKMERDAVIRKQRRN